uniref:Monocarboxylate transporter 6 n=1 Tax=Aceria tosichella TaxID=561515 RepID=A0A6G1S9Z4_9ACAR
MTVITNSTSDKIEQVLNENSQSKSNKQQSPENGFISQYHRELHEWSKNVDKRYAWVILMALFFTFAACLGSYRMYGLIFAQVTTSGHYTREEATWPVSMIFSSENISGPLVSIIAYHISYRTSMLIGGSLILLCNTLTYFSDSLLMDILLIGIFQGFGYAFIFMPYMQVINSYFLKYRNIALGFSLCGGTLSVFILTPLFRYVLDNYHWRAAYLLVGAITCVNLIMVPLLKPNPKPMPPSVKAKPRSAKMSIRALTYQGSIRRQSTILVRTESQRRRSGGSIISVNPFASSVGVERKISRAVNETGSPSSCGAGSVGVGSGHGGQGSPGVDHLHPSSQQSPPQSPQFGRVGQLREQAREEHFETKSLHDIEQETVKSSSFEMSIIWEILRTPGFHVIWYLELTYYWIFSIFCLVLVDFGIDRGCDRDQAEGLLMFQSIGEMVGRLGLTVLADMQFLSCQNTVILDLILMTAILCYFPFIESYMGIASMTVILNAFASLLYILLNGLLVAKLGEQKVTIGYGMASCVVGVLIIFRPQAVGYFRDHIGRYDWLMISLGLACALGAILFIIEGIVTKYCCKKNNEESADDTVSNV